jgi:modification methylase
MPSTRQRLQGGDARSLDGIAAESVHLVVTSPPYPMIAMWDAAFGAVNPAIAEALQREDGDLAFELMHAELDRAWAEVARVLVPGGIACVNIGDATRSLGGAFRMYTNHARALASLERAGLQSLPHIVWRKPTNAPTKFMGSGMLPPGAYVTLEHERILVLRKGEPRSLGAPADRERRRRSAYFWEERNAWFSDIWELRGARQAMERDASRIRSGSFPFELPYRLVAMYSVQGDAVLDPFAGTGTTVLACAALGRNGVGIDTEGDLVQAARDRLAASADELNDWTRDRLERHRSFVRERTAAGKAPGHRNAPHGFAVVTGQETELRIDSVERIAPLEPGVVEVRYVPDSGLRQPSLFAEGEDLHGAL